VRECAVLLGEDEGCSRHGLDAARDDELGVAERYRAIAGDHRLQARPAEPVDCRPRRAQRQARQQYRHACDVAVLLARAVGVAQHDVVDVLGDVRVAVDQSTERGGGQVVRADTGQCAVETPEGGAGEIDDEHRGDHDASRRLTTYHCR
jgi:hypothetical protein